MTLVKLALDHGSFAVLADNGAIQTCYTDRADTSRSSACSPAVLVAFALEVMRRFASEDGQPG